MASHTTLKTDCIPSDKAAWMRTARVLGQPFAEWVTQALNAACIDTQPAWAAGLSERTTIGLLAGGFDSREAVEQALDENYNFIALPNFGRGCLQELTAWLDN